METALAVAYQLGRGDTPNGAARAAGVASASLYRWLARGRAGDARFSALAGLADGRAYKPLSRSGFHLTGTLRRALIDRLSKVLLDGGDETEEPSC